MPRNAVNTRQKLSNLARDAAGMRTNCLSYLTGQEDHQLDFDNADFLRTLDKEGFDSGIDDFNVTSNRSKLC